MKINVYNIENIYPKITKMNSPEKTTIISEHYGQDLEWLDTPVNVADVIEQLKKEKGRSAFFKLLNVISKNENNDHTEIALKNMRDLPTYEIKKEWWEEIIVIKDKIGREIFSIDQYGYSFDGQRDMIENFFEETSAMLPNSNAFFKMKKIFDEYKKDPTKPQLLRSLVADK